MIHYDMPPPWRIEARFTAFSPWIRLGRWHRLEAACLEADRVKVAFRYYAVRVRAF